MNSRFHFFIAILASLLVHVILITLILPKTPLPQRDEQGPLQVFMQQNDNGHGQKKHPRQVENTSFTGKSTVAKHKPELNSPALIPSMINLPSEIANSRTSTNTQNLYMYAMQQAQFAQQRAIRTVTIHAGLSNLSAQLRPLIKGNIDCVQRVDNEFECAPVQKEKVFTVLKQFFDLVIEARKLGIIENPARMDFEPELIVSFTFLP
jgi:hypothetical protein